MKIPENIFDAINTITWYCEKHLNCDRCPLFDEKYGCQLQKSPPCDWGFAQKEEG